MTDNFCPACDEHLDFEDNCCPNCGRSYSVASAYVEYRKENPARWSDKVALNARRFLRRAAKIVFYGILAVLGLIIVIWLFEISGSADRDRYWTLKQCYTDQNCTLSASELSEMRELQYELGY